MACDIEKYDESATKQLWVDTAIKPYEKRIVVCVKHAAALREIGTGRTSPKN